MSGFSSEWLALREPFDAAARAQHLLAELPKPPRGPRRIVDLAAGTGSNLRYLAPRLGGAQEWLLVDNDTRLLAAIEPALHGWAVQLGARVVRHGHEVTVAGDTFEATIRWRALDLVHSSSELELPGGGLVVCSALLDLVSAAWLRELGRRCRDAEADVAFALTYDGRMSVSPIDDIDEIALELFNRHQRGDKGFGPALGPDAARTAEHELGALGYEIAAAASDWRLDAGAAPLQAALLDGWLAAAAEMAPAETETLAAWHARRRTTVARGLATLTVGHRDVVGRLAR